MWHRFISEDKCVSCLTCGGHWCEGTEDDATPCSGDTSQIHGDPRESGHDQDCEHCLNEDFDACPNIHECNCAFCAGPSQKLGVPTTAK